MEAILYFWNAVLYFTDVSEEHIGSIFWVEE
jgi:hypothetical protein